MNRFGTWLSVYNVDSVQLHLGILLRVFNQTSFTGMWA